MKYAGNKMRIIVDGEVIVTPHFSGIGHYTLEVLRAIDRYLDTDDSVKVTVLIYFKLLSKARSYEFRNIRIVPSPFSLRISNGLKIRDKQPYLDLFFGKAIYLFPNFTSWPLLRSKSVPFIYDLSYEKYPQYAEPRNQAFLSIQAKKSALRADVIATISQNSKKEISEFYAVPKDKIGVFYPAVDQKKYYRRSEDEITNVKKKYGIKGEYLLFVGNIEPRKNLKNILLAYEKLDKKVREKYCLLLVGAKGWQDGEIFDIIERLKKKGDSVQLPNAYVTDDDLPAIYSGAKTFIYPSIYEGFGIPPLEAMACGVPVVSADNSSLPEAIGKAGILVDAGSVDDMTKAISNILSDASVRLDLVAKGYEQVDTFSWDVAAEKLMTRLKKLP